MFHVLNFIPVAGSVSGANCKELAAKPDVDGFLVGGASLKVVIFFLFLLCLRIFLMVVGWADEIFDAPSPLYSLSLLTLSSPPR